MTKNKKEINSFCITEEETVVKDDGRRLMPLDEEDRNSPCVWVQMEKPSERTVTGVFVAVEGIGKFPLAGFSFNKACEWAAECPQDLANLLFD